MDEMTEILCVGIDLGTQLHFSVCERHVVDSYVGWPLDMVARKILKKPVVSVAKHRSNRSMLDLHRPLERGVI